MTKHTHENISRRGFLAGGGLLILPSALRAANGKPPSEKLNTAAVGIGGMGWSDIQNSGGENVVALCEVDETRTAEAYRRYPKARRFKDYRRMFDEMAKDIDAVSISTPDHMHEPIAMAAMALGKHIYVQKPMAQTIAGARRMTELPPAAPAPSTLDWPLWRGDKGTIWVNHAYAPVLLPVERMTEWRDRLPPKTLPRVEGSHYANFIRACKALEEPGAPFDYAGPLTQVMPAGAIAQRLPGQRLVYEPEQLRVRGNDQATALIHHSLPG